MIGFTDNRKTLWQEMCGTHRNTLSDPYLRAAFAFLTDPSEKYEFVTVRFVRFFFNNLRILLGFSWYR